MWRPHAQEHFTDIRLWPAATEIVQQCLSHLREQRQGRFQTALRLPYTQPVSPPVDIVEPQANHFASSQTIGRKQLQNGVVAQSGGSLVQSGCVQQRLHLLLCKRAWDVFELVHDRPGYERRKVLGDELLRMQISQKTSQTLRDTVARRASQSGHSPTQILVDLGKAKPGK